MNNLSLTPRAIRFRRFSGKAYAAFCSMHREVTIGRVCARIANLELLKAGRSVLLCAAAFVGGIMYADEPQEREEIPLDISQLSLSEVQVVAQRAEVQSASYRLIHTLSAVEIAELPVRTVSDLLRYVPGLDVRSRGANGSQADVSMRGGTFDQVLVMINGVNLTDAHTGHYSLNLPIDVSLIERIEILQGTSASLFGLNAFSGAINIITKQQSPTEGHKLHARMTAGTNELLNPAFSARVNKGDWYLNTSVDYTHSNGYSAPRPTDKEKIALANTDLDVANVYLQTGYNKVHSYLDIQAGAQYKDAGAGMYYGFGSQDQFDATRTVFGSANYTHMWGAFSLDAQAMYRANYDRYEWHRGQRLYGNFHFAQNAAANIRAHYASKIGRTTIGLEVRNENIHSTNLGDTVHADGQVPNVEGFNKNDVQVLNLVKGCNRLNVNYFAEQSFFWNGLSASLGVSGNWNTMYGHNVAGGANIGYEYAKDSRVYLNANRSLRLPTFTDLFYNAGNQLGDRNLRPESAWTISLGTQYNHLFAQEKKDAIAHRISVSADAYYRFGENIIDWVYVPEDTKRPFHATNHNRVNAAGLEASVRYTYNSWLRQVSVNYAYTYLDLDLSASGSRYLDYLSHKLTIGLNHAFYVHRDWVVGGSYQFLFQKREGQYNNAEGEVCNYKPTALLDLGVYWEHSLVRVSLDITNATNTRYYDYGGLLQPGIWPRLTVLWKI